MNVTPTLAHANALHWLSLALNIGLTAAAAWASFGFGVRLGGVIVGVLAAVNGAVMCSLLVSGLMERIARLVARR
jgi:hypothetical protein